MADGEKKSAVLDAKAFSRHLEALRGQWELHRTSLFRGSDALAIIGGDKAQGTTKAGALQVWLFGVELSDTLLLLTKSDTTILTSVKKASALQSLKELLGGKLNIIKRDKKVGDDHSYKELASLVKKSFSGSKVASVSAGTSEFLQGWTSALSAASIASVTVDDAISRVLSVKDDAEQKLIKTSASITTAVLKSFLISKIEGVIVDEKRVTHADLAKEVVDLFNNPSKISKKLVPGVVSPAYPPLIQSGSKFDLSVGTESTADRLEFNTIICSVGGKYKHYSSDVARTLFVDPPQSVQSDYEALLAAQQATIDALRPGATFASVYSAARDALAAKKASLRDNFYESAGFLTGLEYRDASAEIDLASDRTVEKGNAFVVRVGLKDVKSGQGNDERTFAILLADTVIITPDGKAEVLTDKCTKKYFEVSYELGSEESVEETKPKKTTIKVDHSELDGFSLFKTEELNAVVVGGRKLRNTVQRELLNSNQASDDAKREAHQKELAEEMIAKALAALDKKAEGDETKEVKQRDFVSYKSAAEIPSDAQRDFIFVDNARESVLFPIFGNLVPFHILTIKSVTKSDEYLRIMFKTPATITAGETFKDPSATFVRELAFRVKNQNNLANSLRKINELKKRVTTRETESATRASLKVQPDLILNKTGRNPRLTGLAVRPNLSGRKTTGTLEAHTNGFRFSTLKNGNIDIIYENIKHAFFQPAEKSLIVVVHFHLHSEIMIGKKKSQDVQFYLEVMEASLALGQAKSSRWGDAEEIEDEQRERELINKRNAEFQAFVKKVEEQVPGLEFDIPYQELGFTGVPHRNTVLLQPTVHCLINVIEFPFFVMPLDDVQIAYFERVSFGLRNFDLVFIFNDWTKKEVHINSIPVESLEPIKDWLDSSNIKYYQGNANINWRRLLDQQLAHARQFWEDGGWAALEEEESSEEEEKPKPKPKKSTKKREEDDIIDDEEGGEGAEEEAAPSSRRGRDVDPDEDDDFAPSGSEVYSSSDSGSEFEDSDSDDDDEGGDDDDGDADEDDSGADWDDLEEEAVKDDKQKLFKRKQRGDDFSDDDDDAPKRPTKKARK